MRSSVTVSAYCLADPGASNLPLTPSWRYSTSGLCSDFVNRYERRSRGEAIDDNEPHCPGDEGQFAGHEQLVACRTMAGPFVTEPRSDLGLALEPGAQRAIPDHYKLELRNVGGNAVGRFQEKGKSFVFIQATDVDAAARPLRDVHFGQCACVDCV